MDQNDVIFERNIIKEGRNLWHKKKKIQNFSNKWRLTHPNLKGFDYKCQMNRKKNGCVVSYTLNRLYCLVCMTVHV